MCGTASVWCSGRRGGSAGCSVVLYGEASVPCVEQNGIVNLCDEEGFGCCLIG